MENWTLCNFCMCQDKTAKSSQKMSAANDRPVDLSMSSRARTYSCTLQDTAGGDFDFATARCVTGEGSLLTLEEGSRDERRLRQRAVLPRFTGDHKVMYTGDLMCKIYVHCATTLFLTSSKSLSG